MDHGTLIPITPETAGRRLDELLHHTGGWSLRGAKRLLARGLVTVDGRMRPAQYRVRGDEAIRVADENESGVTRIIHDDTPRLVARHGDLVFVHKPAGMHSAIVSGSGAGSLEAALPELWPGLWPAGFSGPPILLTRLDAVTSGLVTAAASADAARRFRAMEAEGRVCKQYLALIRTERGELAAPLRIHNALDTDNRKKTRVLDRDGEMIRQTLVIPIAAARADTVQIPEGLRALPLSGLAAAAPPGYALVLAAIRRGARHQIRAHLAHAGFPLASDSLYGMEPDGMEKDSAPPFFLHHVCLELPGLTVIDPPTRPAGLVFPDRFP